jgi:hypothetical protein
MWKALVIKELRDTSMIICAATFAFATWLASTIGAAFPWFGVRPQVIIPFVSENTTGPLAIVAGVTAIGLGLRQSTCVLNEPSSQFLLHRPVERWKLIGCKMLVGEIVTALLFTTAILLLSLWASIPGNNPAPFEFWMTAPAWIAMLAVTTVYKAAFLSGLRPARWWGTRLLPIAGAIVIAVITGLLATWSLLVGGVVVIAVNGLLWMSICDFAETRDYA